MGEVHSLEPPRGRVRDESENDTSLVSGIIMMQVLFNVGGVGGHFLSRIHVDVWLWS